jgi:hypothetical protein
VFERTLRTVRSLRWRTKQFLLDLVDLLLV